jgi:putative two-component system response regulator
MQRHPVDGALIVSNSPGLPDAAQIIALEHHIHLDGSGYPRLGPRWRPHLIARIVQVADVFDALATHRPYRAAMSFDQCWEIMSKDSGRLFERDLIEVFFGVVAERTAREAAKPESQAA